MRSRPPDGPQFRNLALAQGLLTVRGMGSLLVALLLAGPFSPRTTRVAPDRPYEFGAVQVGFGYWDVFNASVSIRAIPWAEIEGGGAAFFDLLSAYVRGGPRIRIADFRDESNRGWAVYGAALGGYRHLWGYTIQWEGVNLVAALDAIYWLSPYVGFDLRLSGGATIVTRRFSSREALPNGGPEPDFRLSLGFAF